MKKLHATTEITDWLFIIAAMILACLLLPEVVRAQDTTATTIRMQLLYAPADVEYPHGQSFIAPLQGVHDWERAFHDRLQDNHDVALLSTIIGMAGMSIMVFGHYRGRNKTDPVHGGAYIANTAFNGLLYQQSKSQAEYLGLRLMTGAVYATAINEAIGGREAKTWKLAGVDVPKNPLWVGQDGRLTQFAVGFLTWFWGYLNRVYN